MKEKKKREKVFLYFSKLFWNLTKYVFFFQQELKTDTIKYTNQNTYLRVSNWKFFFFNLKLLKNKINTIWSFPNVKRTEFFCAKWKYKHYCESQLIFKKEVYTGLVIKHEFPALCFQITLYITIVKESDWRGLIDR